MSYVTKLTVDELFKRMRSQRKLTRGRFKTELRHAIRSGVIRVVPGPGVVLELTDEGVDRLEEAEAQPQDGSVAAGE